MPLIAKVIVGFTAKVAVGLFVPSLNWTVLLPEEEAGTVNVAVKPPLALVVEELKETKVPPNVAVQPEWLPSMPVAVIVTVSPTLPELGLRVILELTVKVDVALLLPWDKGTVWAADVEAGTVKVVPDGIVPVPVVVPDATVVLP
jgi:hypothetical protein